MKSFVIAILILVFAMPAQAQDFKYDPLPACVQDQVKEKLERVGQGRLRKFGFTIYHADLWAPGGKYDPAKPYALRLIYARDLDKATVMDAIVGDIKDQDVADEPTLTGWTETLNAVMPAVADGDVLVGMHIPGKKSPLIHNCKTLGAIDDTALIQAFFNIWLGPTASDDMRTGLIASK